MSQRKLADFLKGTGDLYSLRVYNGKKKVEQFDFLQGRQTTNTRKVARTGS